MALLCFIDECSSRIGPDGLFHEVRLSVGIDCENMDTLRIWVESPWPRGKDLPIDEVIKEVAKDRKLGNYETDEGKNDLNDYLQDVLMSHIYHSGRCDIDTLGNLFECAADFMANASDVP
jgi:hypothetical protein